MGQNLTLKPILNLLIFVIFITYDLITSGGRSMREKIEKLEEEKSIPDRFSVKARLNLNDLLRRRSEEKMVDKKTNLLIVSGVSALAVVVLVILSL